MSNRILIYITCLVQLSTLSAVAQPISRYNTFSYNVNEGLLQSTITDMAFDRNNFCWLSFPNGIQKFDGKNFTLVPVQPGLPDDKLCRFFQCSNEDLLISHSQGISKYNIASDRFSLIYANEPGDKIPVLFIGEDEKKLYIYTSSGLIRVIDPEQNKLTAETATGFPDYSYNNNLRPKFSDNIIDHKVAINVNSMLYLWDLQSRKLVHGPVPVPLISIFFLKLKNSHEVYYTTTGNSDTYYQYDFASGKTAKNVFRDLATQEMYRFNMFQWQGKPLVSINNELYETDTAVRELNKELVNFQNQPVANDGISKVVEDKFGNLFLQTVTGGIRKILRKNYQLKYYNNGNTPGSNFVTAILPDKENNRILAGITGNGLLVFDTSQRLIKQISHFPGRRAGTPNLIIKYKDHYLVFMNGESAAWEVGADLQHFRELPILGTLPQNQSGVLYFCNLIDQNNERAIVQSQHHLYKIEFPGLKITEYQAAQGYTMSGILNNGEIITHTNDEMIFLDAVTFKEKRKLPFKNTGYVRCFTKDQSGHLYVGSNKGIFKIDGAGNILQQLNKETGLPDECIYAMAFDKDASLWCSTNKGILKINKDGSILQLKKEDGLQENEFNTNLVAKTDDGELFFAGVNGISSFYPGSIRSLDEKIKLFFTGIKANDENVQKDTAAWNIRSIDLPYTANSLSFDFIAMGSSNPDQYIYQYRMDGIDKHWIQNSSLQTVRYYLPPGNYTFSIYASRVFDKDAKPLASISITIHPPFWKTWWFITALALVFIALLVTAVNRYTKNKYAKKMQELENDRRLKTERERISRDLHDSLGAYANAVLYNTEILEKEQDNNGRKEIMKDLKFASKDIITSLRETVWALNKENYSAEDCLLRIRNFIQPLSRYYQHINFVIEGEAPRDISYHYIRALHLVRIVQEAVNNSIKHADAANIFVNSSMEGNRWKITVSDDGKGFDFESALMKETGNGLNNMQVRATDARFDFKLSAGEGRGTSITVIA